MATILIGKEFLPAVQSVLDSAKKTIYIIIFDWRWYAREITPRVNGINANILNARARGVDIKVIANNDFVKDQLRQRGIACKRALSFKMVHAKMILVDENLAILGSHNFTASAFEKNLEISAQITDPEACKKLTDYFNSLWNLNA